LILVGDHGEEFAEHGGFYHGTTLYEELLHVPLIVQGPGLEPRTVSGLARQIDVAPTVLARLGVQPPATWEGRDLFGATPLPEVTIAEEDHEGNLLRSIRQGAKKLILANEDNPRGLKPVELYDLVQDPKEQYVRQAPSEVETLSQTLTEHQAQAKKGGAAAEKKPMDADAEAELRSLGYVQ
jgi:arylsulfatase A-like enzyme